MKTFEEYQEEQPAVQLIISAIRQAVIDCVPEERQKFNEKENYEYWRIGFEDCRIQTLANLDKYLKET